MVQFTNLIDPAVVAKMQAAVVEDKPQPQVPTCDCKKPQAGGWSTVMHGSKVLTVHSTCGKPTPQVAAKFAQDYADYFAAQDVVAAVTPQESAKPKRLTAADAIDLDPRSEARIKANCVDCKAEVWIDPAPIEGHEDTPRVPICVKCAKARTAGQRGQVIRRPRVAKNKPRVTDNIDHPVTVTKEKPVPDLINIDTMTDAELGAMTRNLVLEREAAKVADARPKAVKAKKAKAKKAKAERKAELDERLVLSGFRVDASLEVPTLNLNDVDSLNTVVSAAERRPYNQARFRILKEGALDPETTTYKVLGDEHYRLAKAAAAKAEAKNTEAKEKATAKKAEVEVVVADVDPEIKAKAKALRKVRPELSKTEARDIVLMAMGR